MTTNSDFSEFSAKLCIGDSNLYGYFVQVPHDIASLYIEGQDRRVVCTLNGTHTYQAALIHDGAGGFYLLVNAKRKHSLGLVLGESIRVRIAKDRSEYGLPMSDELREVLAQDETASAHFHALSPGKQRTMIYWVGNVKNPDIRIRRALVMCEHLRQNDGNIDYKMLNESLKLANKQARGEV